MDGRHFIAKLRYQPLYTTSRLNDFCVFVCLVEQSADDSQPPRSSHGTAPPPDSDPRQTEFTSAYTDRPCRRRSTTELSYAAARSCTGVSTGLHESAYIPDFSFTHQTSSVFAASPHSSKSTCECPLSPLFAARIGKQSRRHTILS